MAGVNPILPRFELFALTKDLLFMDNLIIDCNYSVMVIVPDDEEDNPDGAPDKQCMKKPSGWMRGLKVNIPTRVRK